MGTGFKGGASHHHTISENISDVKSEYPYSGGYFGKVGKSGNTHVRNIESDDPVADSKKFYDKIARGGVESPIKDKNGNVKGHLSKMADGSIVSWREVSNSDGSPAVDINIERSSDSGGIKQQKIHFVLK